VPYQIEGVITLLEGETEVVKGDCVGSGQNGGDTALWRVVEEFYLEKVHCSEPYAGKVRYPVGKGRGGKVKNKRGSSPD